MKIKAKKAYKSWLKDGVHGKPCSMDILVNWLSCKSNYKRWNNKDDFIHKIPKKELLEEIIERLRQCGIYHRLPKDVASKISTIQANYRITRQWKETEGYRLMYQPHGQQRLQDELVRRFPYWNQLHPVFKQDTLLSRHDKQAISHQRRLVQYEKLKVEQEFIQCLHLAGFSPSEALLFV